MRLKLQLLALIVSSVIALDCNVTLPRLLLGEKYHDFNSNEAALVLFDTLDYCDQATLIPKEGSGFSFRFKQIILQYVNTTLNHSGSNVQFVHYKKYTNVFSLDISPGVNYTIGFMGNQLDLNSVYGQDHTFVLPKYQADTDHPLKVLFYGDQDLTTRGANTLNYLNSHLEENKFDTFIFLGDYAYEFYENNGTKGDLYLEQFTPLSWSYPLVMTPGNHEDELNFTLFNEKFRMPTYNPNNLNNFNSFNIGLVHFLHVNLDFYYLSDQYNQDRLLAWVELDLSQVDREVTPWVIAVGHKLMYCFNPTTNNSDCMSFYDLFSKVDSLFEKYNLDFFITGHEHYNQVMAPMSNQKIHEYELSTSTLPDGGILNELNFNNGGYVSIVQGNGGCITSLNNTSRFLQQTSFNQTLQDASLFNNMYNVGFGWIEVLDATHIKYSSYDAENDVYLTQFLFSTNHGIVSPPEQEKENKTEKGSFVNCMLHKENYHLCLKYLQ